MPFSQLLSKLLDSVNLGKILVDGGPGLLLALSILLLACHTIVEEPPAPPGAQSLPVSTTPKPSYVPFLKLVVKSEIDAKKAEIKAVEQEASRLAGCTALEDQKLQDINKRIAAAEQGRVHLAGPASEPTLFEGCGENAPRVSPKDRGELSALYQTAEILQEAKAKNQKNAEFAAKHLDDSRAMLEKKRAEYIRDGRTLLSEIISLCLGLSIFGYILGTLFSGLNRTVWLLQLQRVILLTLGKLWETASLFFAASPEEMAKISLRGKMQLVELKFGTSVVLEDPEKDAAIHKLKTAIQGQNGGAKYSLTGLKAINTEKDAMDGPEPLKAYPVTYYLGRGIISQDEYNGFITGYYRWAEGTANLIFPVLIFGYAMRWYTKSCDPHTAGTSLCQSMTGLNWIQENSFTCSAILAVLLYVAAQLTYSDYKRRLRDFIKGKLDLDKKRRDDAAQKPPTPPPTNPTSKPGRQRLEIIAEGDQASEILKRIEQLMQGVKPS